MKSRLESKLTNYDAFQNLKTVIIDDTFRHKLAGLTILAAPSMLIEQGKASPNTDVTDPRYKILTSELVRNTLIDYSKNVPDEEYFSVLLEKPKQFIVTSYGKRELNLPYVIMKIYRDMEDEQKLHLAENAGKIIENRLKGFYYNRGYNKDPKLRADVGRYLGSEYEFFTRIFAEFHNRMT